MEEERSTWWTVIRGAAAGKPDDREKFAALYLPVVRAYLAARWKSSPLIAELEDGVQEVFVACFKEGGALERLEPERATSFRAYLYGVARNIARRLEEARTRQGREVLLGDEASALEAGQDGLSTVFDRAWARAIVREAAALQERRAKDRGEDAARRVELLRLRFQEGLPIREIARLWQVDAARLHREYPKARTEFAEALFEIVSFHHPGLPGEVERECARLLRLLA